MLAVTRFRVDEAEAEAFAAGAERVLAALAARPGFRSARVGRAPDDPALWVLLAEWDGAGAWRRALSAYPVRVELMPLVRYALDEPGAYEILLRADSATAGHDGATAGHVAPVPGP